MRLALGSDVGAGTGFCLFKEGLQAYFMQQLLGAEGLALTSPHLLHLATTAGADALGLGDTVGQLSEGYAFDAVWVRPAPGSTLEVALRHARTAGADVATQKGKDARTPGESEGEEYRVEEGSAHGRLGKRERRPP